MPSIADIKAARAAKAATKATGTGSAAVPPSPADSATPYPTRVDPGELLETRTSARLTEIAPNPLNPRTDIAAQVDAAVAAMAGTSAAHPVNAMAELIESMRDHGQLQPVAVITAELFREIFRGTAYATAIGDVPFVIVGGGRRYAAAPHAGLRRLGINVLHGPRAPKTIAEFKALTAIENVQRETLSVMQTARSIRDLREEMNGREVAEVLRKTPAWVTLYNQLADLPAEVQAVIESAPFSLRQARRVYEAETPAARLDEAQRIRAVILGVEISASTQGDSLATGANSTTERASQHPEVPAPRGIRPKVGRPVMTRTDKLMKILGEYDQVDLISALRSVLDADGRAKVAEALIAPDSSS